MSLDELTRATAVTGQGYGGIDWRRYFVLVGKEAPDCVLVNCLPTLASAVALLHTATSADLRSYLRWHGVSACAAHLPERFATASFKLRRELLVGQVTYVGLYLDAFRPAIFRKVT